MRFGRSSLLIGTIAIVLIFFAVLGLWGYNVLFGKSCPPGEIFGSPGAPSYCVPANYYPTITPNLTPIIPSRYGR
jgi:hypothetical protein